MVEELGDSYHARVSGGIDDDDDDAGGAAQGGGRCSGTVERYEESFREWMVAAARQHEHVPFRTRRRHVTHC